MSWTRCYQNEARTDEVGRFLKIKANFKIKRSRSPLQAFTQEADDFRKDQLLVKVEESSDQSRSTSTSNFDARRTKRALVKLRFLARWIT